jgi:sugar lactone lactonase YvrE
MKRLWLLAGIIALTSVGCSAASTNPGPPPGSGQFLYVSNFSNPGQIAIFSLPLSGGSVPTTVVAPAGLKFVVGLAFDHQGNLWAVNDTTSAEVTGYKLPLTSTSTPFATINIPGSMNPVAIAFDAAGNLWVGDGGTNKVYEFVGPFSGSITPAPAVTISSVTAPGGIAFDAAGNLYVSKAVFLSGAIEIFNPPFTTGQLPTGTPLTGSSQPNGLAFDATGNLYTANVNDGSIDRFNAPTAAGGPISTHLGGSVTLIFTGEQLVFDTTGNLYASNLQDPMLYLFPNAASTFSTTTPVPTIITINAFGATQSTAGLAIH